MLGDLLGADVFSPGNGARGVAARYPETASRQSVRVGRGD
jgi:hypothetical protein